ncbi:hypothetical protein ACS0TY_026147 [Phlomoides rotata]
MAKLIAFAALFVALIASATAYTTVVTTVITTDDNPHQSCQKEVQQMEMKHCMQWMEKEIIPSFLRSVVANPEEQQHACCGEMKKVRADCQCEMIKKMMMMQPMMEMEKMRLMFGKCGMQVPMECSS